MKSENIENLENKNKISNKENKKLKNIKHFILSYSQNVNIFPKIEKVDFSLREKYFRRNSEDILF